NATQKHGTRIEVGKAAKITVGFRQRGTSGRACCGNHRGQLNGIHAAAGQDLMRILHEPKAIVPVCDVIRRDYRPLSAVGRTRFLAAPKLSPRSVRSRLRESPFIQENMVQSSLPDESFDFRQSMVPIEVGIIHQEVARPSDAEQIQEWKVIWISPDGGGQGSNREADDYPVCGARQEPV